MDSTRHARRRAIRNAVTTGINSLALFNPQRATRLTNSYYRAMHKNLIHPWLSAPMFLLHVPKSAGTSMAYALGKPDPGHLRVDEYPAKIQECLSGRDALLCIREPVDRFESSCSYMEKLRGEGNDTFVRTASKYRSASELVKAMDAGYCADLYFLRSASSMIESASTLGMKTWVVGFDKLDTNVAEVARESGHDISEIPKLNVGQRSRAKILCGKERAILNKMYAEDHELYQRSVREGFFRV